MAIPNVTRPSMSAIPMWKATPAQNSPRRVRMVATSPNASPNSSTMVPQVSSVAPSVVSATSPNSVPRIPVGPKIVSEDQ